MSVLETLESLIDALEGPRGGRTGKRRAPRIPPNDEVGKISGKASDLSEQDETNPLVIHESEDSKKEIICKVWGTAAPPTKRKYRSHAGIGELVVELLLQGKYPTEVAEELDIIPTLEQYYRGKAEKDFVIKRVNGTYPLKYIKGPKYQKGKYKKRKSRRSSKFVNPEARVHTGNGDFFRIKAREGDLHWLKTPDGLIRFFPLDLVGSSKKKHFNYELDFPADLLGYEGGKARLSFYPSNKDKPGYLTISPPELRLSYERLVEADIPFLFARVKGYIVHLLSKNGWTFHDCIQLHEIHYAFSREVVQSLVPELMDFAPSLKRGDSEDELLIFVDQSIPGGELETTSHRAAIDILAVLTIEYRRKAGGE
jgi:hypothetical protein